MRYAILCTVVGVQLQRSCNPLHKLALVVAPMKAESQLLDDCQILSTPGVDVFITS